MENMVTFSTANLERPYPFTIEPIRVGFYEINKYTISSISIYITDVLGRIINLNDVDVSFSFILKELELSYLKLFNVLYNVKENEKTIKR